MNRRLFLQRAALGAAALPLAHRALADPTPGPAASNKINVAGIGIGGQGGADIDAVAGEGANIVALCDVDSDRAAKKFEQYAKARRFTDYRVLFDQMGREIDAVVIGTPDHSHAVIAAEAMRRGKHVYCEKPLAHSVHEVRALMAAADRAKVVTQLGNQGHSDEAIRRLCEWVWAGAIGHVHTVHAACNAFPEVYCQLHNLDKLNEPYTVPASLDYDLWLGPVPFLPYRPFTTHWTWRGWLPFGTGTVGDWFCHVIDPSFWALDLGAPTSVQAEVTNYDPVKHGLTYPPGTRITYEFPAKGSRGPVKLVWHDGTTRIPRPAGFSGDDQVPGTGAILFGEKGMIVHGSHGAGGCRLLPDDLMDAHTGNNAPPRTIPRVKNHAADWMEAIRTGRQAGSHFGYGGPLTEAALLGAIAIRFPGVTLQWDAKAMRFTNHELANAFVHQPYRPGWAL